MRNPMEIYHSLILALNQRPLSISHHPSLKNLLSKNDSVITPLDLHYGRRMNPNPLENLRLESDKVAFDAFRKKWDELIQTYNQKQDEALAIRMNWQKLLTFK